LLETKKIVSLTSRLEIPPALVAALEERLLKISWMEKIQSFFAMPKAWVPAGALAALALIFGLWFGWKQHEAQMSLPLEALLAAHSRYSAETLVPHGGLAMSNFSHQMAIYQEDEEG